MIKPEIKTTTTVSIGEYSLEEFLDLVKDSAHYALEYEVFVSDSLEVIEAAEHGIIKGQMWEYCKKGSNYGLRIYHEKESSTQN